MILSPQWSLGKSKWLEKQTRQSYELIAGPSQQLLGQGARMASDPVCVLINHVRQDQNEPEPCCFLKMSYQQVCSLTTLVFSSRNKTRCPFEEVCTAENLTTKTGGNS